MQKRMHEISLRGASDLKRCNWRTRSKSQKNIYEAADYVKCAQEGDI